MTSTTTIPVINAKDLGINALRTFFVREDAFGLWRPGERKGRTEMGQVSQALLDSHLAGTARVGAHSTNRRDEAKWFVIDLDGLSVVAVQDIIAVSKRETVPVAVEASKSPGRFHIWGFFADLVPAWKGRALGRALVKAAGWDNRGIEIFPKQDSLMGTDKQLGNFLWLPWHGVDLPRGRTAFLDTTKEQWHPFPDQVGYLMALERIPL